MSDDASTLAQWIAEAHDIVFFGGAGVSTESGIPDFRGAKGFYHQEREIPLERVLSIDFFSACPGAYYAWFAEETAREGVAPNAAHRFLADLERAGKLKAVVTQNIDGLHQAAGSKRVLELHGNWTRLECTGAARAPPSTTSTRPGPGACPTARRAPPWCARTSCSTARLWTRRRWRGPSWP